MTTLEEDFPTAMAVTTILICREAEKYIGKYSPEQLFAVGAATKQIHDLCREEFARRGLKMEYHQDENGNPIFVPAKGH
jgi:hypothetical protein